jgi:hypothetical protein
MSAEWLSGFLAGVGLSILVGLVVQALTAQAYEVKGDKDEQKQ